MTVQHFASVCWPSCHWKMNNAEPVTTNRLKMVIFLIINFRGTKYPASDTRHSLCICGHWGDVIEEELHWCTTYFKNLKKAMNAHSLLEIQEYCIMLSSFVIK